MSDAIVAALIGVAILVMINIILVAFTYGRLSQKVDDFCRRVDKLESKVFGNGSH